VWNQADLRVNAVEFEQRLLAGRGLVIGRLDARYTGADITPLVTSRAYPVMRSAINGVFTVGLNEYLSQTLDYATPRRYEVLNDAVSRAWDWRTPRRSSTSAPAPATPTWRPICAGP